MLWIFAIAESDVAYRGDSGATVCAYSTLVTQAPTRSLCLHHSSTDRPWCITSTDRPWCITSTDRPWCITSTDRPWCITSTEAISAPVLSVFRCRRGSSALCCVLQLFRQLFRGHPYTAVIHGSSLHSSSVLFKMVSTYSEISLRVRNVFSIA